MNKIALTDEQKSAIEQIKHGGNYVILGGAGTGKSTLLQELRDEIPDAVFAAPTGAAAQRIGGVTLNSLFRIPPHPYITTPTLELISDKKPREIISSIRTLVIDEVSMVRADMLAAVDYRLRQYGPCGCEQKTFGGRQVILCGDWFQLPPVVTNDDVGGVSVGERLETDMGGIYPFCAPIWRNSRFAPIYLRHNLRQDGDRDFQECLAAFRSGDPARHQRALQKLNSRVCSDFPDNAVYLCPRRSEACEINNREARKINTEERTFQATISGDFTKDFPVPLTLRLKLGDRVIIAVNIAGIPNGTVGIVSAFGDDGVTVKLGNGREVFVGPHEFPKIGYRTIEDPITHEKRPTPFEVGSLRQLPLLPGYAITIHKSQGMTLPSVVFDRGNNGCFAHGQCYVAVSRVRRLKDLFLVRPLELSDIVVAPEVLSADEIFRCDLDLWVDCVLQILEAYSEEIDKGFLLGPREAEEMLAKTVSEYDRRFEQDDHCSPDANESTTYWCKMLRMTYLKMVDCHSVLKIFSKLYQTLEL